MALVAWLGAVRLARLRALLAAFGGSAPVQQEGARILLVAGALCCTVLAIAGPRLRPHAPGHGAGEGDPPQTQGDAAEPGSGPALVILMDASLSMTVEDELPDRSTSARLAALRIVTSSGLGRVGVVAFAAQAHLLVPPTSDLGLVTLHLEGLDAGALTAQGTDLAQGLDVALDALGGPSGRGERRSVVVVSDGEGFQEDEELQGAVARARDEGITVHTVAVGTEEGGLVPGALSGGVSRARPGALGTLARATGGRATAANDASGLEALTAVLATPGAPAFRHPAATPSPLTTVLALVAVFMLIAEAATAMVRIGSVP
jgi:Mg-chelatase subunit ChlD